VADASPAATQPPGGLGVRGSVLTRAAAGILLLLPVVVMALAARDFEGFGRTYALLLLVPLAILLCAHTIKEIVDARGAEVATPQDHAPGTRQRQDARAVGAAIAFAAVWAVYAYTWGALGFIIATSLALSLSLVLLRWRGWVVLPGAILASLLLYWVLTELLTVAIPRGPVEQAVTNIMGGG
jgi:hypothetical protein